MLYFAAAAAPAAGFGVVAACAIAAVLRTVSAGIWAPLQKRGGKDGISELDAAMPARLVNGQLGAE